MTYSFSPPEITCTGYLTGCMQGYLYGTLCKVSPSFSTVVFAIRELVNPTLFKSANRFFKGDSGRQSAKIYMVTNLITNMFCLSILYHFDLITRTGIIIFSAIMALEGLSKCIDFKKYKIKVLTT
jgi:hypothetical protein